MCKVYHGYTWMVPRRNDRRLRHTGNRMSMQLKLRQAAGALAQDRACWRHKDGRPKSAKIGCEDRLKAHNNNKNGNFAGIPPLHQLQMASQEAAADDFRHHNV